jgi:hypothetical protein
MLIKELLLEDEVDQPKDPNLLNVNADTHYRTSKADQIFWKPGEKETWLERQKQLETRAVKIYSQLQSVMPKQDRPALRGIPVLVPFNGVLAWAIADYSGRKIELDLGCFWDLSNDCLAYTIGHEIGHHVYNYKNPNYWKRDVSPKQNRRLEMDADVYGALLAYDLGYDRKKAFDNFTVAYQREPFDPKEPSYPSVGQRKQNVDKALQQKRNVQKDAWLNHIMQGMNKFEVALAQNPNMALA